MESAEKIRRLTDENKVLRMATAQWEHLQKICLESNEHLSNLEHELREVRQRIERSLTAGDLAWWDWDYASGKMYYNQERGRLLGYTMEELPRNFGEVEKQIHPDELDEALGRLREHIAGRYPYYEAEYRLRNKEGKWKWFYDRGKVMERDIMGEPLVISGVLIDIDDRKQAEKELKEARDLADAASRAKSLFLANMSHEIYTPLAGVVGMADILQQSELSDEQSEYLDIIVNSATNLMAVLNDIMEFIKVENERIGLVFSPVQPARVLEEITRHCYDRCKEKGVELMTFLDPRIPEMVIGDPKRLTQLFRIFVNNAVKFTDLGRILLSVEFVSWDEETVKVRFRISDTGVGIAEEDLKRLFQSFSRVNTKVGKYGGSGLGLAIADHLVRLMNGTIEVQSEVGVGSSFCFMVDFDRLVEQETFPGYEQVSGKRMLLIDNHEIRRALLRDYLLIWDAEVEECATVATGREKLMQLSASGHPVDLILTELQSISGEQSVQGFPFSGDFWMDIPVVLLTDQNQSTSFWGDPWAYYRVLLERPFLPRDLLEAVDAALARKTDGLRIVGAFPKTELVTAEKKVLKILLAEDNLINQRVALVTLRKLGHEADLAEDGRKALELYRKNPYDLVLMDIFMPELNGLEAARAIRELESETGRDPVHICAITANVHKEDEDACYASGMNSYITKPFNLQELNVVLNKLL